MKHYESHYLQFDKWTQKTDIHQQETYAFLLGCIVLDVVVVCRVGVLLLCLCASAWCGENILPVFLLCTENVVGGGGGWQ